MNEYNRMLTIRVGRRPQRSAARPNKYAPTGRIANVSKMANVTSVIWVLNSCAMSLSTNTSRKKSKASRSPRSAFLLGRLRSGRFLSLNNAPYQNRCI